MITSAYLITTVEWFLAGKKTLGKVLKYLIKKRIGNNHLTIDFLTELHVFGKQNCTACLQR